MTAFLSHKYKAPAVNSNIRAYRRLVYLSKARKLAISSPGKNLRSRFDLAGRLQ